MLDSALVPERPRLVVIRGNDRGREFELKRQATAVGRGRDNHIVLRDLSVSRHHVTILQDELGLRARDEGSGNGTLRNGEPIAGEATLDEGDELEIGSTVIRVVGAPGPAAEPPGPLAEPVRVPKVETRPPRRDPKPFFIAGGAVIALGAIGVLTVAVLNAGPREAP